MKGFPRFLAAGLLLAGTLSGSQRPRLLTDIDLASFPSPSPDRKIAYGKDPLQFGELRIPQGPGPHPIAILIHGGCWRAEYDITHIRKLSEALRGTGLATWTLEYRRVGNPGGGWPGTFQDVADGADHLRELAREYPLDLDRVLAIGHSAGGHLALWLLARGKLSRVEPFRSENPMIPGAVLALAPAPDLAYLYEQQACGNVVEKLLGGSPDVQPERYRLASANELVPLGAPQILVLGKYDDSWTPVGRRYYDAAKAAGDDVRIVEAPESGHFEVIDPDSTTWPLVRNAAGELVDGLPRR